MGFEFSIPGASPDGWFIENSRGKDTITVWLTDSTLYNRPEIETVIRFPFTDTLGITDVKYDTLQMRYIAPRAARSKTLKRIPYKVSTGITGQERPDKRITITAPSPFLPPDTSRIALFEMLKEQRKRQPFSLVRDTSGSCRYYMDTRL